MEQLEPLAGEKDFAFYEALNEVLTEARRHIEEARYADDITRLGIRLKMAQNAIECAIIIYGDKVAEMVKEKEKKCEPIK